MRISPTKARRLALNSQFLYGSNDLTGGKEGVARLIEKLGYVQIDTISVIERAHHHTLWTRLPDYTDNMLHDLQAADRRVFEYWGHAMSYLPITDYRFYLPRMKSFRNPTEGWAAFCFNKCKDIINPVRERLKKEGPLTAKDFEPPKGTRSGAWWGWRPAKVALELLFWQGELMIAERRKFLKVYDLTERVLPESIDTHFPSNDELGCFVVNQALRSYGIAKENEVRDYIRWVDKDIVARGLSDLIGAGKVVKVAVGKTDGYYSLADLIEKTEGLKRTKPELHLLSPFDNLIIQRDRVKQLFNFNYALECYVPARKRKHGYFVLPILWGDKLVGRLDPKADRKKKKLIIHRLLLEEDFRPDDAFSTALARKLASLAAFNACESVSVAKSRPSGYKSILARVIRQQVS